MKKAPELLGSAFADLASNMSLTVSNFFGTNASILVSKVIERRVSEARDILLEEIGRGARPPKYPGELDEFVAILYRYLSKAQEGTARLNLRLMARVAKNQIEGEGLYASAFLRYSSLLASLSREEVITLATVHRCESAAKGEVGDEESEPPRILALIKPELIPRVFPTEQHLLATMTALQRTGLLWTGSATWGGGFVWETTPLLDELVRLANFESAIAAEEGPS